MHVLRVFAFLVLAAGLRGGTATEIQYLSGRGADDAVRWDFFCTAGRNSGVWTTIPVPSCWEVQGFGTYDYGVEVRPSNRLPQHLPPPDEKGIYRRDFTVPADWADRAVRVVFEGVLTDAEVRINGRSAGPVHQGGFYRFHHDISDKLRFGETNTIEVTVSKRSTNDSVNRAERYADYWNFGGIFRPVWLEARPGMSIERVAIDARADGAFTANVFLGDQPADAEIALQIETLDGKPVGQALSRRGTTSSGIITVRTTVPSPSTWSAETPSLYRARFTLRAGGRDLHVLTERFGFRTFEVRPGDGLYLNGSKIVMKGVNRHSFHADTGRTLSQRRNLEDVMLLKEANLNAVRMSHYPPDPGFLDLCDEAGLYVLNELAGWQQPYDTPTSRRLIAQLVARDVNHPSVVFWNNGNEGGENVENDDEFTRHDPQQRTVLHPWARSFRGLNTQHYREYAETQEFAEGPDIFMPTEFLHGLFDGGAGAGLDDYWRILGEKPRSAGGFLWVWADEGVVRSDEGGRIDARRDLAPDGVVGPRGEKSGSFNTIREIWSPVQVNPRTLPDDFRGELEVQNRYDFLNLKTVTFEWRLMKFAPPGALLFHRTLVAHGRINGPDVAPRGKGLIPLPLPQDWRESDVLYLTAIDSRQRELWTWTWRWKSGADAIGHAVTQQAAATVAEEEREIVASAGRNAVRVDRRTGRLAGLLRDGRPVSLANGPRLTAYRREARVLSPVVLANERAKTVAARREGDAVVVDVTYDGPMRAVTWTLQPDGDLRLDYRFSGPGVVDVLGIDFDYPEEKMKAKEWLGNGPFRVWQNRLKGVQLARWLFPYNDPIPGVSWENDAEFKGWFSGWEWMAFTTTEGRFAFINNGGNPFIGVYSPRDGINNPVLALPRLGLGVYQVIPAIGTKQSLPHNLGPQGQPQDIRGDVRGSLVIRLLDQP